MPDIQSLPFPPVSMKASGNLMRTLTAQWYKWAGGCVVWWDGWCRMNDMVSAILTWPTDLFPVSSRERLTKYKKRYVSGIGNWRHYGSSSSVYQFRGGGVSWSYSWEMYRNFWYVFRLLPFSQAKAQATAFDSVSNDCWVIDYWVMKSAQVKYN